MFGPVIIAICVSVLSKERSLEIKFSPNGNKSSTTGCLPSLIVISEEELIQELDSIEEIDIGDQEDDPIEIY